jgi:hypothetical protein
LADPNGCWANSDTAPTPGCQTANGMADPVTMALSPAGDQMYVGVDNDVGDQGGPQPPAGIALFNRELPPTCAPASATVEAGETATLTPACSGANGNPVTIATVGAPTHGSVRPGPGGQLLFDPDANFVGTATFSYRGLRRNALIGTRAPRKSARRGAFARARPRDGAVRRAAHADGHGERLGEAGLTGAPEEGHLTPAAPVVHARPRRPRTSRSIWRASGIRIVRTVLP